MCFIGIASGCLVSGRQLLRALKIDILYRAPLAQLVEQLPLKQLVTGSSPVRGTEDCHE